jgi:RNA polymerase sigma factor (sigma-70 family)
MTTNKAVSKSSTLSGQPQVDPILKTALVQNRKNFLQFLTRRVENKELAEEILQQFCIKALNKGGALKNPESVVAWLYRVLNSTLTDFYRSEAKRRQGEAEYTRQESDHVQELDVNPVTVCLCLYKLLPTLKAEYSEILQRIDLSGESHASVARDLRITDNLVRVRLHRARQALKQVLLRSCCKTCHEHGFMNCECTHGLQGH